MDADVSGLKKLYIKYMSKPPHEKKDIIIVRLCGGLGNQMFQYALGKVISIKTKSTLKLDVTGYDTSIQGDTVRTYDLNHFNVTASVATLDEVNSLKYPFGTISKILRFLGKKIFRKFYIDYHPELLDCPPKYLDGFFQSEKYFLNQRIILLKDFSLKDEFHSMSFKKWKGIISDKPISVSIHVRRGDYVLNASTAKIHGVNLSNYYSDATDYVSAQTLSPYGFVFSDDIEWVKKNIIIPFPVTYVSDPSLNPQQELTLMSLCTHNIIANSSFSWWGAWLNTNPEKIVTAPRLWTVSNTDHLNIIPTSWVRI